MSKPRKNHAPGQYYSIMDELMASPTKALPMSQRDRHLQVIYGALASIESGPSPTMVDVGYVSDALNMLDTLINTKFNERGTEYDAIEFPDEMMKAAVQAIVDCAARQKTHGVLRFDAKGMTAMRELINFYSDLLEVLPARIFIKSHREYMRQVADIKAGKAKIPNLQLVEI